MTQMPKQSGLDLQSLQVPPTTDSARNPTSLSSRSQFKFEDIYVYERVSQILAPYFVVLVGLLIYDRNFILGTVLIIIGLLVLFKVTGEKVMAFVEEILRSFGAS